ncbi:hypothetical protein FBY31_4457 [Arthrobacter sp. SLBN-100]|nr:hypothetical protein FBY31_4457 [Arthrobacter sp. SLBN-100]
MGPRYVLPKSLAQKTPVSKSPDAALCAEEAPPRQTINIDELCASPWVGLHYRQEFLLHHRHELLMYRLMD